MTRTESDLREALRLPPATAAEIRLAALIHDLADEDALEPALPTRTTRTPGHTRWPWAAAAVAVLGLATAVGIVVGTGDDRSAPTGARPSVAGPRPPRPTAGTDFRSSETLRFSPDTAITTTVPYGAGRLVLQFGRTPAGVVEMGTGVTAAGRLDVGFGRAPSGPDPLRCGTAGVGFHCGQDIGGVGADHHEYLIVGYVIGDGITTVRIAVDGTTYRARTAAWSADPRVHAYWLAGPVLAHYPAKGSQVGSVGTMAAYDANGRVVASEYDAVAHG